MRSFFVALLVGLVLASAMAQEVVVLNTDNFDSTIESHDLTLVEFFAPWCGHCKQLAPKYATAAELLASEGITNAILASVDCTVETELASRFHIEGYPTLLAFKRGATTGITYSGAREVDALVAYLKKKSAPAVAAIATTADLDAVAAKGGIVLFGGSDDDLAALTAAADQDDLHNYYSVSDSSIISAAHAASPSLKLYRSFTDTPAVSTEFPINVESIVEFVEANGFPLVSEINQDSYSRLSKKSHPLIIFVSDAENVEEQKQWLEVLTKLAGEFPNLSVTYGPSSQLLNAVKQFGGSGNVIPSVIGFVVPGMSSIESPLPPRFAWPEDTEVSEATLRTWFQTVVDGNPKVHKKSEPVPEDNSAPVKVVVALTFDEIVLNSGKNVLVEFYAPWCGHCKSLAPIYDATAEQLLKNSHIVLAKIDATENFVDPTYNIQGFPTLILFKADGSKVPFEGERTSAGIIAFFEEHVGNVVVTADAEAKAGHDEL